MKESAGLLLYQDDYGLKVLLVHPGGPFFARKDEGVWSVPKGELEQGEDPLKRAIIEFEEETGQKINTDNFIPLGEIRQKGGKKVTTWAFKGSWSADQTIKSNTFKIEFPPRSGQFKEFPEVDKAKLFDLETARQKINPAQIPFLQKLEQYLKTS